MPKYRVQFHTKHNPNTQTEIMRAMDERELLDIYDMTGAIVDDYEEVTPHPVDEAQAIERVIDSSLKMIRIPFDDHSVPVGERVAILQGTSELLSNEAVETAAARLYAELDGTGNDPDLVTELRGGF